ncbi:type II toxin-antitoxin system HicB family antitoxin [Klebsiella aerogenes]|uniref:type II toxin-antitoxin system HicB family antitoxin n=1 Tax=Klebsiella aerogenes TaxID=548 RepID=UPI00062C6E00|nr:type II toxin-antitoxin system HicB family antitoxin [Klebsiella aerogenes]KKY64143.1 DNA repair protein [Klebsiella aerogenes]
MNNVLKIHGHQAVITFDDETEMLRGEFVGLNGGADFYAHSMEALKKEGAESLRIFLDECRKDGIEPYKSVTAM